MPLKFSLWLAAVIFGIGFYACLILIGDLYLRFITAATQ